MDNPTTVTNTTEVKPVVPKIKEPESVYTIDELARNHKVLNASFAIVKTALKLYVRGFLFTIPKEVDTRQFEN